MEDLKKRRITLRITVSIPELKEWDIETQLLLKDSKKFNEEVYKEFLTSKLKDITDNSLMGIAEKFKENYQEYLD